MSYEMSYLNEKEKNSELELKNKALMQLLFITECFHFASKNWYGDGWEEVKDEYLKSINKQEIIIWGEALTRVL